MSVPTGSVTKGCEHFPLQNAAGDNAFSKGLLKDGAKLLSSKTYDAAKPAAGELQALQPPDSSRGARVDR